MNKEKIINGLLEIKSIMKHWEMDKDGKRDIDFGIRINEKYGVDVKLNTVRLHSGKWKAYHLMITGDYKTLLVEYDYLSQGALTEEEILKDIEEAVKDIKKLKKK